MGIFDQGNNVISWPSAKCQKPQSLVLEYLYQRSKRLFWNSSIILNTPCSSNAMSFLTDTNCKGTRKAKSRDLSPMSKVTIESWNQWIYKSRGASKSDQIKRLPFTSLAFTKAVVVTKEIITVKACNFFTYWNIPQHFYAGSISSSRNKL